MNETGHENTVARAVAEWVDLLPKMAGFDPELGRLGEALLQCWQGRGKVLTPLAIRTSISSSTGGLRGRSRWQ